MTLIEFAKGAPEEYSDLDFVTRLGASTDLDAIIGLSDTDLLNFFSVAQFLADHALLIQERRGMVGINVETGEPIIQIRAPHISTILTRAPNEEPDFSHLGALGLAKENGSEEPL